MFKDEYNAMFVEDHEAEKKQPCPPELARTKILEVDGFKCKVYYNYAAPYTYGIRPMNCWWAYATKGDYYWQCPLSEKIETLEDACDVLLPLFTAVVKRWKSYYMS